MMASTPISLTLGIVFRTPPVCVIPEDLRIAALAVNRMLSVRRDVQGSESMPEQAVPEVANIISDYQGDYQREKKQDSKILRHVPSSESR